MTSSLNMIRGRSNIVTLTNNSGGALVAGDVCVQDTSADEKVTTTTSAASVLKVFVAAESIAAGAAGRFYESGYCPLVNVSASVTRGRFLFTHTVAKQAAESATYGSGAFGKILKSGTTPSSIIYSATAQIGSAGVARSGSTTDGHLAVWNGSSADSIKDGGAVSSGALAVISEQILVAPAATVTFSSIPGTYRELELRLTARTNDTNGGGYAMSMRLNNDSGNNYRWHKVQSIQAAMNHSEGIAVAQISIGDVPQSGDTAGFASTYTIRFADYARTSFHKRTVSHGAHAYGTASGQNMGYIGEGYWSNTDAITQIDIFLAAASQFAAGSIFTLYGYATA